MKSRDHDCDTVRELVFDMRRGDLSEVDEALLREKLDACPECARFAERIEEMLDLAMHLPEDTTPALDGDALFAGIAAEIDAGTSDESAPTRSDITRSEAGADEDRAAPSVRLFGPLADGEPPSDAREEHEEGHDGQRRAHPAWTVLASCAAAAALFVVMSALGVDLSLRAPEEPPSEEFAQQTEPVSDDEGAGVVEDSAGAKPVTTTEPERATSVPELAGLRARATSRDEELRLFADEDAEYTLRGERDLVLVLERGTLLVEYLPETSRSLEVRSGGRTIDVVGTVFFVSSEPENHPVGVLAGAVEVREEDASSPKRIEAGESLTGDGESAQFRPDEMDEAIASIDLEEHHRRLERSARRRARRDAEEAATRRPKPSADEPPTLEQKRARAERDALAALSRREYGAAARHYERLLSMVDAGATRASTTRLELAQIYAMHLGRRARAIDHLRAFLDHHPEDVAAPSARARLCELLGPSAHAEPRCGEASVRGD